MLQLNCIIIVYFKEALMSEHILDIFAKNGIQSVAAIKLCDCNIVRQYKLERAGFHDMSSLSAIVMAIPYLTPAANRNISAYATSRDYHLFFKELFASLIPQLKEAFPQYSFAGFADDSPIDERDAAAKAGLGMIGDNGLLITPLYSSYVFLGEIITDMPLNTVKHHIQRCEGCGACQKACPIKDTGVCLSELTQKKGELYESERQIIKKYASAWGCDICQEVCPHTKKAIASGTIYTSLPFFKESLIPYLTSSAVEKMTDEEFSLRAYSWRKRATISRNLNILEDTHEHTSK